MSAQPVLIDALDLSTAKPLTAPGTLQDCLNYRRDTLEGATRIGGIERYDGTASAWSFKFLRLTATSVTGSFTAGMAVYFTVGQTGYVLNSTTASGTTYIDVVFKAANANPSLPATLTGTGGTSAPILSYEFVSEPRGTQSTFNTAFQTLVDDRRSSITTVPGRGCTDIIHLFWFKNYLYAVRDLPRVYWSGGEYSDANEGRYITLSGSTYEVLNVTPIGQQTGYLTLDTSTGTGPAVSPTGSPTVGFLTITGTLDDGHPGFAYSDSVAASLGIGPYTYSIVGAPGHLRDPIETPDPDSAVFGVQTTDAALYKATSTGWERVNLGRELQFREGTANLVNFDRTLEGAAATVLNTGFVFPTSSTFNGSSTTTINADDGTLLALTGATGDWFFAGGFSLTSIPDSAIIKGIEVVIERRSDTANQARDQRVDLMGLTGDTINKAKGTVWPNTIGTATYGGATDLWGNNGISVADLKGAGFGVRVYVQRNSAAVATVGGVDYVKIKVYYVQRDFPAYVWDGTADEPITIRHIQILDGDANTYEGWMSITAAQNADKVHLINDGDQIRTAASGGGNLLAVAAGRDRPIWLPGQVDIDRNESRYQTIVENFYYQDDYEAAFTVQGVGPAWSFDGERTIRIRVPLGDAKDVPRHIARHGERLALLYWPGVLILSKTADPYEMRGDQGAQSKSYGDRGVGLRRLNGDTLGILCAQSTHALSGFTASTFFSTPISTSQGSIEYCSADIGRVMSLDGTGAFFVDVPDQTGGALRDYVSAPVRPWLEPRLAFDANSQQRYLRPITALAVRNLRQARWFMWDGYILTMTDVGGQPKWTIQRYFDPSDNVNITDAGWPVRAVCSGIDATGRERLFCSFFGVKEGYVFEMDAGRSFDGDPIPAYVTLNPIGSTDMRLSQQDRIFLHAMGQGFATIDYSRAVDFKDVDTTVYQTTTLGASTDTVSLKPEPMRGKVDMPVEGYDFTLRFDSESESEAPHTLQMLTLFVESRGQSKGHTRA